MDESFVPEVEKIFREHGIKVLCTQRLLGGVSGDEAGKLNHIRELVRGWKSSLESLASIAESEPQAAFSALTKSIQFQWSLLRSAGISRVPVTV